MDMTNVRVDTYTNSSRWVDMILTHMPTGNTVEGRDESPYLLRKRLVEELEKKVNS